MTRTKNIPIKKLLLHISNVISVCDLSSVTPKRVKQYLMHRFKNTLPSEDDLDTILENFINSVKLSQVLNGGSVHFQKVNKDSLNAFEANLKATVVEYETEDPPIEGQDNYVPTKKGLTKERFINSKIKRANCYPIKNIFNSNLKTTPTEVLQNETKRHRKSETPAEVLQNETKRHRKSKTPAEVDQLNERKRHRKSKTPAEVLQNETKRHRKSKDPPIEGQDNYVPTKKGLTKERFINSKIKRANCCPIKNIFNSNLKTKRTENICAKKNTRKNLALKQDFFIEMFSAQLSPSKIKDIIENCEGDDSALAELEKLCNK